MPGNNNTTPPVMQEVSLLELLRTVVRNQRFVIRFTTAATFLTDRSADLDTDRPAAPTELGEERRKEKTVGLLFLALLFALIFWDAFWFLSKFLLAFVIVYILYLGLRSRS